MSPEDKEMIKRAVLESIAKQNLNIEQLAQQACKAIDYINSYQERYPKCGRQHQFEVYLKVLK